MVEIIDDVLTEVDEFFTVSIGDSECSIAQNTATVTILDDESKNKIKILFIILSQLSVFTIRTCSHICRR